MTKELNLFLGETKEPSSSKISSEVKTEKTGNSMFDKILLNIKEENEVLSNTSTAKPSQNTLSSTPSSEVTTQHSDKSNVTDNKINTNSDLKKVDTTVEDKKTDKSINNLVPKEIKEINEKSGPSTLSLLDRMMLEANTKINTESVVKDSNPNNGQSVKNITVAPLLTEQIGENSKIINKQTENKNIETLTGEDKSLENIESNKSENDKSENDKTKNAKTVNPSEVILKDVKNIVNNINISTDINIENPTKKDSDSIENVNKKEEPKKVENISLKVAVLKEQIIGIDEPTQIQSVDDSLKSNTATDKINFQQSDDVKKENLKSNNNPLKDEVKSKINVENIINKEINTVSNKEKDNVVFTNQFENKNNASEHEENSKTNSNINLIKDIIPEEKNIIENKETKINDNILKVLNEDNLEEDKVVVTKKEIEVKTIINDGVKTTNVVEKTVVKNENVANELSKIIKSDVDTVIDITQDEIEKLPDSEKIVKTETSNKEPQKTSLLDKLIEESKQLSKNQNYKIVNKEEINTQVPMGTELTEKQSNEKNVNSFFTNMYLSSQKNNLQEASIVKVATGKKMATDATSIKDVEKSAEFLDLGFEDSEVTVKMQEFEKHSKLNILDKLAFTKTVMKDEIINNNTLLSKYSAAAVSSTINTINTVINTENETVVQLNVSPTNVMNIESRIIGARQQMGTMMSEVARNMYLNYKPPVTAFRINLTPGNLGSIAILMKNDKENGLTISLNMSNTATLDSFVDNQASLRAALAKNFNSDANFTLDFNMQEQNSGNGDTRNKDNNQNNQNRNSGNQDATEVQDVMNFENQESRKTDYM